MTSTTAVFSVLFLTILLFFAGLQAYFLSRRIAGPIFSIQKQLEEMKATQKFKPIRLRKDDQFQDLVRYLNELGSGKLS